MKGCVIGIIGNVGPEVDETLQRYIREESQRRGAATDQDHPPIVVIKNPSIPDRTSAILYDGPSPVDAILHSCELLERCGAYIGALPSNTAQYFRKEFQHQTSVYVPPLLELTAAAIKHRNISNVGLLCTAPTRQTGIYTDALARHGITTVYPDEDLQESCVQGAIYGTLPAGGNHKDRAADGLKSGLHEQPAQKLIHAVKNMRHTQNIPAVIMGCTEIPLIEHELQRAFPDTLFIDPMRILAVECLDLRDAVHKEKETSYNTDIVSHSDHTPPDDRDAVIRYLAAKL